jgi:transposase
MKNLGILGIDVSKGYADFVLLNQQKKVMEKNFQLDDNHEGHLKLKELLHSFCTTYRYDEIQCAVESTGGYENNWFNKLSTFSKELPLKVTRLNPRGVKANREASLSRNVTDEMSSNYIAEYLISHPEKVSFNCKSIDNYDSLRSVYKYIKLLKKQSTQLSNQLEKHVYKVFPELLGYCRSGFPSWVLELLEKYPTSEKISRATVNGLSKIKYITPKKAENLIKKARNSVSSMNDLYMAALISSQAKELIRLENLIDQQKKLFSENVKGEDVELLKSIKGFGSYSAAALIIEIEDINRFDSAKKLSSYAGIHPEIKESGDMKKVARMSKTGRSGIREVMFHVARTAAVYDPHIKAIYVRLRKNNVSYYAAIGFIMHKMLRIAYGVLKNKKTYDSEIDKHNQAISQEHKLSTQDKQKEFVRKSRRFQSLQEDAPISRRNNKKRKALLTSQSNNVTKHGIEQEMPQTKI